MTHFERDWRRLIDRLVGNLVDIAEVAVREELTRARMRARVEQRSSAQERRLAARRAREATRLAKREARLAERAERERLRAERRAERERLREEVRAARERQRELERVLREQRRGTPRRPSRQQSELLGTDVLRPTPLFVHKRKTDGSIQPLQRGDAPSAPPPPAS